MFSKPSKFTNKSLFWRQLKSDIESNYFLLDKNIIKYVQILLYKQIW